MKLLGIGTGNLHKLHYGDINKTLETISEYNFEAVEITYGLIHEVNVNISDKNIEFLRQLKYKTIHFPFSHELADDQLTRDILKKIGELYSSIGADHLIIHPSELKDFSILDGFDPLFENLPSEHGWGYHCLKSFFKKHNFGFVLDTTHAMTYSDRVGEIEKLLTFGDRLKQVHLSNYNNGQKHQLFYNTDNFNIILDKIKNVDVPIILEANIPSEVDLEREIEFLRGELGF